MPSKNNAQRAPELQTEEDNRVDGGSTASGVTIPDEVTHERQIQHAVEVAIEVVSRDEVLQRHGLNRIEVAWLDTGVNP
jgi:hypothetical protein